MNKAVAVMQVYGATEALKALEQINYKKKLESFYLYHSLLGEIHSQLNQNKKAKEYFEIAVTLTQSETEKKVIMSKIMALGK